jgi:excisionase family DNA binding protein
MSQERPSQQRSDLPRYLSVADVASVLGVEHKLIRKLIRSGKLAAVKVGPLLRISQLELETYLARQQTKGPEPVRPAPAQMKRGEPVKDWFS